jgi:Zn-dependent M28 family amino/carboxypeptidase
MPELGPLDNGAGVAVAMEAVRILQALNLKPRRTIRVALWTGEEQRLVGIESLRSRALWENRNSTGRAQPSAGSSPSNPRVLLTKPAYEKFSSYFNLDNGTEEFEGYISRATKQCVRCSANGWSLSATWVRQPSP